MRKLDFIILKNKILSKLDSQIIESNDTIVNLYDLKTSVSNVLSKYNNVIYKESNKLKNNLNKELKNQIDNNKKIQSINAGVVNQVPYILIETSEYINSKLNLTKILYMKDSLNSKHAKKIFNTINEFIENYPDIDFIWNQDNRNDNIFSYSDGFLCYMLDLRNVENPILGFEDSNDAFIASLRVPDEGGELYDYVDFYKDSYLKRQAVPINSLPTQFKNIYLKTKEKSKTLKK